MVQSSEAGKEKLSSEQCLEAGFNSAELWCERCYELDKFDLQMIKPECLKCCRESISKKKYSYARLEYCECNIANFPQVKAFIRGEKPQKYSNLKIKFVRGALPILKLLDDRHNLVDELNIQKWDTDTIDEFLSQHIS
ncbi:hypothetical protein SSS_06930 [Sarcoptes scabiei]|nr:hypothetical protein SSS_06930 [Sarcoptes scabiei]KPM03426.1 salivary selenoprotein precursor-like protein [Sarcoptes scabiei]